MSEILEKAKNSVVIGFGLAAEITGTSLDKEDPLYIVKNDELIKIEKQINKLLNSLSNYTRSVKSLSESLAKSTTIVTQIYGPEQGDVYERSESFSACSASTVAVANDYADNILPSAVNLKLERLKDKLKNTKENQKLRKKYRVLLLEAIRDYDRSKGNDTSYERVRKMENEYRAYNSSFSAAFDELLEAKKLIFAEVLNAFVYHSQRVASEADAVSSRHFEKFPLNATE